MTIIQIVSLYSMALLYIAAGINHFVNPSFYLKITPKWVPKPEKINLIVGSVEIFLGIALLINATRPYGALGIILLLVAVFPANIYHFQKSWKKGKSIIPTLIRLPIQGLLMYWAYTFI